MKSVDARSGIEVLHRDECLRLLEHDVIGRLAVIVGGAPTIFPVNYRVDGESIVFRSDPGTKVDSGPRARACFEIDHFDRERRSGWSVVVSGRLDEVTPYDRAALERAQALPIDPWAGGAKAHWMRLTAERVTGRRVGEGD
jgi:nitroimidazol reductase NimA-like FMN-containing flavoprotein (pyridoxamine 5'-phosphate oxidase superfamily)